LISPPPPAEQLWRRQPCPTRFAAFLNVESVKKREEQKCVEARPRWNLARNGHGGGIAVQSARSPKSVYVAYPGSDVQVEVYDPSPERARRLALSDRLRPLP